jgi:hypothetical protein
VDIDTSFFSLFRQMFIQGTVAEIGGTAFTVYCAIKAHVDFSTGESFPSQKLLAEQTGFSERQIIKSLKILEQHRLLEKTREHTRNIYRLKERLVIDKTMVATWDYLPATLKKARQELRNFALTGELKDAKVIHIEIHNLTIDTFVAGDHVTVEKIDLNGISDPVLRTIMERLLAHRNARRDT